MMISVSASGTPSIQANGGGGAVKIVEGHTLALTIQLNAEGQTNLADWWLLANAGSSWYYYLNIARKSRNIHFSSMLTRHWRKDGALGG
ncbi:MAG: hypothetical protein KJ919_13200 [Verrucomicrobia bacterium]|nr:hypothetical protein [Verrucomicrobiota bacterium]